MNFQILCVGKIKEDFYRKQIEILCTDLKKRGHVVNITEFPDERIPERMPETKKESFLEKECGKMSEKILSKDYVIVLCIEGKEFTTRQHRDYIDQAVDSGFENITYVIGGSLGLPESIKRRSNLKMSFSKMTFPHQLIRVVLLEEITRAMQ